MFHFAGVEGIEPPLAVLETAVLPLNDTPSIFNLQGCRLRSNDLKRHPYAYA